MTNKQTAESLANIKWVESAEAHYGPLFVVKSKPNTLRMYLTHKIVLRSYDEYDASTELPEKMPIYLPQYYIHLEEERFSFQLANKPEARTQHFGVTPQYHTSITQSSWNRVYHPCYGYDGSFQPIDSMSTIVNYTDAETWEEKAQIAVIFVQSAQPHYGKDWYRTMFAYRLGLVGEEMVDEPDERTKQQIAIYADQMRLLQNAILNQAEQEGVVAQVQIGGAGGNAFGWTGWVAGTN